MKEQDVYQELTSIRALMERSSKFISLSGLAGVLAGVYALMGVGLAYMLIRNRAGIYNDNPYVEDKGILMQLILIASGVLILSIITSYWLSMNNAKRRNENVWNPVSKRLLVASGIPFVTGGFFILILLLKGHHSMIVASCLIFYGLALVAGSQYTFNEVRLLGIGEILLGFIALIRPGDGPILWAVGFGLLHIIYGSIMHFKYER